MDQIQEGIIVKGYSGFYYVAHGGRIYECSLRGKNKKKNVKFLPGDRVRFFTGDDTTGAAIEEVLPRKNELLRPPVANVDQLLIFASVIDPKPDFQLIDRLTVFAEWNGIEPIICFTKCDLISEAEQQKLKDVYAATGYPVLITSTVTGQDVEALRMRLHGKSSVIAGNSGVGKSTMMNAISGNQWELQTGDVSERLKRGKHTTRHVEFYPLDEETFIADTPGFSTLTVPEDVKREELSRLFADFREYLPDCRFATCQHKKEPDCAVKQAVEEGKLSRSRYDNYLVLLEEVIQQERRY